MLYASKDFIDAMTARVSQLYIKLEILDKEDNVIDEITDAISWNDIGDISVDSTSDIHRQFSITLNNHSGLFTWGEEQLIWIDKKKAKFYIGFETPNGIEYIPQGVFILTSPQSISTPTEVKTIISGQDLWYYLTGNFGKYIATTTYDAYEKDKNGDYIVDEMGYSQLKTEKDSDGNTIVDADGNPVYYKITNYIKSVLQNAGITKMIIDDCDAYLTTDLVYEAGENRGTALKDLTSRCYTATDNYFYECYFDVNGYFRFQKIMKPTEVAPCWTYEINDVTIYAGSTRSLEEDSLFNHIVVRGGTNDTTEFFKEIVVDETKYQETKYGDATVEEFNKGTYSSMETDVLGKLQLLQGREEKTLSDGTTKKVGNGIYSTSGSFTSRWFDIGADAKDEDGNSYTYKESFVDWIQVLGNKTEEKDGVDITHTISVNVEFSNDKTNIIGSGTLENGKSLPYLTVGEKLPQYMRYKVSMTSTDSSTTPILTNLQFSVTVDNLPWKGHPYSIQNIGDRVYIWNDGIDSNIDSQEQCSRRAKYELEKNLAYIETVDMEIVPNYLHEENDVISIIDKNNGCIDNYQIISFNIPVKPSTMSIKAKKIRQVV